MKAERRHLDPAVVASALPTTPVKSHTTLLNRPLPSGWTIEKLPDNMEEGNESYRYTSPTRLCVIETIRLYEDGKTWQHVSVSYWDRLPSWADLGMVKRIFMGNDTTALQVFPPASRYVSIHPYVLHLWRCLDGDVTPEFSRVVEGERQI